VSDGAADPAVEESHGRGLRKTRIYVRKLLKSLASHKITIVHGIFARNSHLHFSTPTQSALQRLSSDNQSSMAATFSIYDVLHGSTPEAWNEL